MINNVTILILVGAAVIRERERGTIEHLLVMPVQPSEIAAAKIWADGFIILLAAAISLHVMVHVVLQIPVVGSVEFFLAGAAILLAVHALASRYSATAPDWLQAEDHTDDQIPPAQQAMFVIAPDNRIHQHERSRHANPAKAYLRADANVS